MTFPTIIAFHRENIQILVYNICCTFVFTGEAERMTGINGYISIREASCKWGASERRVTQYCAAGRIPALTRFGRAWAIPSDAEKPIDPRKNTEKRR